MSKKKRSKKRERIPVIDTLIDLAGAMTLDYLAAKRRQKYGTKHSKKIDPYAATGAAMGMGLIKDTDDLIKFGVSLAQWELLILMMIHQSTKSHTWLPVITATLGA